MWIWERVARLWQRLWLVGVRCRELFDFHQIVGHVHALGQRSWLCQWSLGYFHAADGRLAAAAIAVGTAALAAMPGRSIGRWEAATEACLMVPAAVVAPWPFRAAVLLVLVGLTGP